ncbi:MAG: hypothetical protein LBR64_01080 [Dysgonamonadaceae bacterium]|jgi:hypothetical protein|nr:hypothetical protein [Dysgonamonadaceae bacterium]
MKRALNIMPLAAIFMLLTAIGSRAMAATPTGQDSIIAYTINLGDLTDLSEDAISTLINKEFSVIPESQELTCSVTIKGKVSNKVSAKKTELDIELTVSGSCCELKSQGKQVAKQLFEDVRGVLKKK